MISAITHIARLARAGFVFAREGVFGVVDPSLVPPPGQLALRLARIIERPGAKSGPRLSRALTRLGPAYLKLGQFLATRPDVVGVRWRAIWQACRTGCRPSRRPRPRRSIARARWNARSRALRDLGAAGRRRLDRAGASRRTERDGAQPSRSRCCAPASSGALPRATSPTSSLLARTVERFRPRAAAAAGRGRQHHVARRSRCEMDLRLEAAAASELAENTSDDPDFRVPAVDWEPHRRAAC